MEWSFESVYILVYRKNQWTLQSSLPCVSDALWSILFRLIRNEKTIIIMIIQISVKKEINIDRVYPLNRHHNITILHDFIPLKSFTLSNASLDLH